MHTCFKCRQLTACVCGNYFTTSQYSIAEPLTQAEQIKKLEAALKASNEYGDELETAVEGWRAENAELIAENAELRKQLQEIKSGDAWILRPCKRESEPLPDLEAFDLPTNHL